MQRSRTWVFGAGSPVKWAGLYELLALRRGTFCNLPFSLRSGSTSGEMGGKNKISAETWSLQEHRLGGKPTHPPHAGPLTLASALWSDSEWILWVHITNTCLQILDYAVNLTLCVHHFFLPPCDILYLFGSYGNRSCFNLQVVEPGSLHSNPRKAVCDWYLLRASWGVLLLLKFLFLAKYLTMFLSTWQIRRWCAYSLSSILVSRPENEPLF